MNILANQQPKTEILLITPGLAKTMLERNAKNRNLRVNHVQMICREIQAGRWVLNGDSIRFGKSGNLLDGQHRLHAIVMAGIAVESYVIWDLPDSVFLTIDSLGAKRGGADVLQLAGYQNSTHLASIARLWAGVKRQGGISPSIFSASVSATEIEEVVLVSPDIIKAANYLAGKKQKVGVFSPVSISGLCYCLFGELNASKRDEFFEGLASGANLHDKHPVLVLRNRLITVGSKSKSVIKSPERLALWVKAWNAFRVNKPLSPAGLRWTREGEAVEKFPQPI